MGRIFTCVLVLLSVGLSHSQIINFPDINFKNKVIADGHDTNNDGEIQISEAEAVTELRVTSLSSDPNKITDMTGIEHFVNLIELRCGGNEIVTLDVTALTQLELLYANFNELTSINVTGLTALRSLWVPGNQLASIDISSLSALWWIYCTDNQLTQLDVSGNPILEAIWAGENQISSVDFQNNPLLQEIQLYDNSLSEIDVTNLNDLVSLRVDNNSLTEIDVSGLTSLFQLWVGYNDIQLVDVSMSGVGELHCENNPNLTYINAQNGVISDSDPDLLYWGFYFYDLPNLEVICMDPGEEYALSESGYDPSSVIVTTQPDCSLSTDEFAKMDIKLYRNPVSESFTLESAIPIQQYALITTSGSEIIRTESEFLVQEKLRSLASGLYFLELTSETGDRQTLKFLKE